ncbi:MAG: amino acid permease [Anaerolineae bacterium]
MSSHEHHDADKHHLHSMGYAQELSRRMSGFSNFAISFSIICILAGGISSFYAAFNATGSGGAFIGWLVGGAFAMLVSLSMGQIASAYPTAGGLYHWSSILGGKFWGWLTAWFNLLGLLFVVASVDVFLYQVFFKGLLVDTVLQGNFFGMDASTWGIYHQHAFVIFALVTQALLNHYGIDLTSKVTDLSGYLIFALTIIFIIALFAFSPVALDFSRLFAFTNYTGEPGGSVIPDRVDNIFLAFFFGLIYVMYTITGFDASGHTSEETHNAQVNVPKGMWTSVFWSWTFGLVMVAAFVLTMPSIDEGAAAGFSSFNYMWNASRMPDFLKLILAIGFVVVNYICALAGLTSTSRMMYAFARDGGLPFSHLFSHISTQYRTPTYSIWTAAVLAFVTSLTGIIGSALGLEGVDIFLVLATGCAVFLYISYTIPVIAGFFAEGKTWTKKGPFNLGPLSKPIAIVAAIGVIALTTTGFFPPNTPVFYLTLGMVVILPIAWLAGVKDRFEGVPIGNKIKERQGMIAEIEARFEGG